MARAAQTLRMTVDEFLAWDDGTDTRHELEGGVSVAMAPPSATHARVAQNASEIISRHVKGRRPCRAMQGAGVVVSREDGKVYVPDAVMTCEPLPQGHHVAEPRLIVEVLSPSTEGVDKWDKAPAYAGLPTVEEIWLVDSRSRNVLVWRKVGGTLVANLPYKGSQGFESPVLGGAMVSLDDLYDLTGIEA